MIDSVNKIYEHFMHDSIRRNSMYLILSQAVNAFAAFIFWLICARLFNAKDVGLATSFISYGILIATFTNLGLPNTILRFIYLSKKKGGLFTGSIYLILFASFLGAVLSIVFINLLAPKLDFVKSSAYLLTILILFIICCSISTFMDSTLLAFSRGKNLLIKALIINVPRVVLPFFVVGLVLKGIVSVYVVVLLFGIIYNIIVVSRNILSKYKLRPDIEEILKHRRYAISNYLGGILGILPSTLVPLIILGKLGAEKAAYFYIPMQIAALLSIVASSTSQAMLSESSTSNDSRFHADNFVKAIKHIYSLLIPIMFLVILFGWLVLFIYGKNYASNGYVPLVVLTIACVFVALNWIGDSYLNVKKRNRDYFLMNAFNSIVVVSFVYLFSSHGLVAASIGWLIGQLISAGVYLSIFAKSQLFSFVSYFKTT